MAGWEVVALRFCSNAVCRSTKNAGLCSARHLEVTASENCRDIHRLIRKAESGARRTTASPARPKSIMAQVAGSGVDPTTISSVKLSAVAPLPQVHT